LNRPLAVPSFNRITHVPKSAISFRARNLGRRDTDSPRARILTAGSRAQGSQSDRTVATPRHATPHRQSRAVEVVSTPPIRRYIYTLRSHLRHGQVYIAQATRLRVPSSSSIYSFFRNYRIYHPQIVFIIYPVRIYYLHHLRVHRTDRAQLHLLSHRLYLT
jgi:hypothetical protein